jgi:hypothetical protein
MPACTLGHGAQPLLNHRRKSRGSSYARALHAYRMLTCPFPGEHGSVAPSRRSHRPLPRQTETRSERPGLTCEYMGGRSRVRTWVGLADGFTDLWRKACELRGCQDLQPFGHVLRMIMLILSLSCALRLPGPHFADVGVFDGVNLLPLGQLGGFLYRGGRCLRRRWPGVVRRAGRHGRSRRCGWRRTGGQGRPAGLRGWTRWRDGRGRRGCVELWALWGTGRRLEQIRPAGVGAGDERSGAEHVAPAGLRAMWYERWQMVNARVARIFCVHHEKGFGPHVVSPSLVALRCRRVTISGPWRRWSWSRSVSRRATRGRR